MKIINLFFCLLIILNVQACNPNHKNYNRDMLETPAAKVKELIVAPDVNYSKHKEYDANMISSSTDEINLDRKVTKEGEISFETNDIEKAKLKIEKAILEFNGYISNDKVKDYSERYEQQLSVRVPADKFDSLLIRISENADRIESKNITVTDVTEEYIDLDARLRTKKELELRYQELLKKASKVEEILSIETQMGIIREEIESVEGRFNYLKKKISLSVLSITFYERTTSNFGFGTKLGRAVRMGWDNLLGFFIGIVHVWPFILGGGLAILLLIRWRKRKMKKKE